MAKTAIDTMPQKELVRAIGRWSLTALVVNFVIGGGIFGLPSAVAAAIGWASIPAVLLAGVAIAVITACFAEVASRFTESGGAYLYVREAFGRLLGIQVAWLIWLVRLTASAANANLFVTYLGEFWHQATQPVPRSLIITLLIGILAAVNYRGVRAGAQLSNVFTVAKLLPLGLVCIAGMLYLAFNHHETPMEVASHDTKSWAHAMVLLIFAYGGFEGALISMGEAKNPRRDTAFALFVALAICSLIYLVIQFVVVSVLPDPRHRELPLAEVARVVVGHVGAAIVSVGAMVSVYGFLSANILGAPRMTFALAQRGDFPSPFGAIHDRFRTPHVSILVFALLVWLLALFGSFAGNATLSAASRLAYYGLVCAALPLLRKKQSSMEGFRIPGGTVFAVVGVCLCLGLLTQVGFSNSAVLVVTMVAAFLNWVVARWKGAGSRADDSR